ncbi:MAG TPA: hypothetical protein VG318_11705, partial [Actinomycetota bacterium]|nr:hypothetical protein [Actinomycetota bacterium]
EMRRRLAEAEAGRSAAPAPVVPSGWDEPHAPVTAPEPAATEDVAGAGGWPAPPAEALRDEPDYGATTSDSPVTAGTSWTGTTSSGDAEPGPEIIDWGSGSANEELPADDRGTGAGEVPTEGTERATPGISLDDIWTRSPAPDPAPAVAPDPATEVQWHEPARDAAGSEAASPPAPRRANADIPDDEFYGPRKRRWFRRRR